MKKNVPLWKKVILIIAEIFLLIIFGYTLLHYRKAWDYILILLCMIAISLPLYFEKKTGFSLAGPIYVITIIYGCGNIFGVIFALFGSTVWFDKIMHGFAGFLFAALGYYHLAYDNKGMSRLNKNVFAFSFSMTVSVIWEMIEFTCDRLFNLDMQMDSFITGIHTHIISDDLRRMVHINNISDVVVNGQTLAGYIDIGLLDTMYDLIMGAIGALILVLYTSIDKDRHGVAMIKR